MNSNTATQSSDTKRRRRRRGEAVTAMVVVKGGIVLLQVVLAARSGGATGDALGAHMQMKDLPATIQAEMRNSARAALDSGQITRAQYEQLDHKINSYGPELKALAQRLVDEQSGRAGRHLTKAAGDVAATVVFSTPWARSAKEHAIGSLPGLATGTALGNYAGDPLVGLGDVQDALGPLRDKWSTPDDAFTRAQVAARTRAFIDHIRGLEMSPERRREWIANFIHRLETEGWDKALSGVDSRQDLKKFVADEARKYAAADKALTQAGLAEGDKDYAEVRKRLLDEMVNWDLARLRNEDLAGLIERIREQVKRGEPPQSNDPPPVAVIRCSKYAGQAPLEVRLLGSASQGKNLEYVWSIGGLGTRTGALVEHTFKVPDRYPVRLTVSDPSQRTSSAEAQITVFTGWPLRVSVEGIKCEPRGATAGSTVRIAAVVKVSGLVGTVAAPVQMRVTALGQTQDVSLGERSDGLHLQTVEITIPDSAKVGPQTVAVMATITPPDPELYAHKGNQLSHTSSHTLYVRDPFLGTWKGAATLTQLYPKRRTHTENNFEMKIAERRGNVLVMRNQKGEPLEARINNRTVSILDRDEEYLETGTLIFDGETMKGSGSMKYYKKDPDTGQRELVEEYTLTLDFRRVQHPGEPEE